MKTNLPALVVILYLASGASAKTVLAESREEIADNEVENQPPPPPPMKKKPSLADAIEGNANETTDSAFGTLSNHFKDETFVTGPAGPCSSCVIHGMDTIRRTGPVTTFELDDDRKLVKINVGIRDLNVTCECTFGLYLYVSGRVSVRLSNFSVYLDLLINFANYEATEIRQVSITDPGQMTTELNFYGVVGNILDVIFYPFSGMISSKAQQLLQTSFPDVVSKNKERLEMFGYLRK